MIPIDRTIIGVQFDSFKAENCRINKVSQQVP